MRKLLLITAIGTTFGLAAPAHAARYLHLQTARQQAKAHVKTAEATTLGRCWRVSGTGVQCSAFTKNAGGYDAHWWVWVSTLAGTARTWDSLTGRSDTAG